MVYSDNELLTRIAEGDEHAFSTLYFRYDTMLYTFLLKLTRSESTAEELLQETFLRLWLYRDSLAGVEHPSAFIHRIAASLSQRWLQQQFRHHRELQEQPDLTWKDMEALVARIIADMPEQRRNIYQLHRDGGLSFAEIAEQVGVTTGTVRNTIAAAIRQIREQLPERRINVVVPGFLVQLMASAPTNDALLMEDRERRLSAILEIDKTITNYKRTQPLRITFRRWGWVAAAVLLLLSETAVVMLAINANRKHQQVGKSGVQDLATGSNKPVLRLDSSRKAAAGAEITRRIR